MKLIALALLSATFALANPVPATEEAAPIDFEKRGVGFADGGNINGLGFGGNNFGGLGTGFPPEFFTNNNLFNTAATNNLAFANNDRVRENIDAQHNTALNANTAANTAAANTAVAAVRRHLMELQRRGFGGAGFGGGGFGGGGFGGGSFPFFTTNANLFNTAAANNINFADNDRVRENIDAQHNTALNANTAANTLATNTAVAAVRRHLMELQRRGLDGSSFATGLDGTNGFTGTSPFLNDFALLSLLGFGGSGFNTNANSFSSAGTGGIGGIGGIGGF